ncbi:MAG: FAD binding domain-containing protein [Christensenellales bacterium]|jgi:CO/xanthine dehydrogenase FAD-binding subunit|nr:fAD binding domain in molybdopterin dehydrogenase [Clostridium sp. CAG:1024]
MREFEFLQPKSIAEAIAMRVEHGDRLVVYNGGTDIVIQLRDRLIAPDYVMDVKKIPGLHEITFSEKEGLFIGACVTMNEIGGNEAVRTHYPFLAEAALSVGSKQVRNRATSVGNIVNASPLCDTGTPLYAADAVMCLEGPNGKREVPIREFITFVRRTVLQKDEIVTGIKVPYDKDLRGIFTKVARRREVDLSTICATVARSGNEWKLAFGAVAPTPVRLPKTEELLRGKEITEALIDEAAKLARTEVSPIDDVRASKEYRLDVVEVIVRRSLKALA